MAQRFPGLTRWPLLLTLLAACGGGQATGEDVNAPAEVQGEAHAKVTLVVQLPQDGDVVRHDQPVRFLLGTDCLTCAVRGVSNLGGELFSLTPSATGVVDRPVEGLAQGVHRLSLQVLASDGELLLNRDRTVRVNHPPAAPSVALAPDGPLTGDDLLATVGPAADEDADPVSLGYAWTRDGVPVPEADGPALEHTLTAKGQAWRLVVTPADPYESGQPGEAQVVIADSPPAVERARVEPAEGGTVADTFRCAYDGWSDPDAADPEVPAYVFKVNGLPLEGGDGSADFPAGFRKHDRLSCRVTPTDGDKSGVPVESEPVEVANALPTVGWVELTSDQGDVTGSFNCVVDAAQDADTDQVSLQVHWIVDGQPWPGETSQSLAGHLLERGQSLACEVNGFDGEDPGPALRSETMTVLDAPPSVVSAMVTPLEATEATVLTCEGSGVADPDGDEVSLVYAWTVNDQVVPGAEGPTLDGASFARGDVVRCAAIPVANGLAGAPVEAKLAVAIGNSPPSLAGARVWPAEPREGDQVECQPDGPTDLDGDSLTYAVAWRVNGLPLEGWEAVTLTGQAFDKSDLLACTLTPHDGLEAGAAKDSDPVTADNSPPLLAAVALDPAQGNVAISFACLPTGLTDPDPGDTVVPLFSWYLDEAPVPQAGLPFLTLTLASAGQVLRCSVVPFDGTDPGAPRSSNPVTLPDDPAAFAEICDLIDNDSDGLTDEGLCDDGNPCTDDACRPAAAPPPPTCCLATTRAPAPGWTSARGGSAWGATRWSARPGTTATRWPRASRRAAPARSRCWRVTPAPTPTRPPATPPAIRPGPAPASWTAPAAYAATTAAAAPAAPARPARAWTCTTTPAAPVRAGPACRPRRRTAPTPTPAPTTPVTRPPAARP